MYNLGSKENEDFYLNLRKKVLEWLKSDSGKDSKWQEYILLAPDLFYLLCKLMMDKDVPIEEKRKIAFAIGYFVLPFDLMPEAILGAFGYADDIVIAAYLINKITNSIDPEILQRNWPGDSDVLENVKHILKIADEMIGSGLWHKIRNFFSNN
ncbi:MAG: DUF1232 domain-containing protein [Candidatus Schekmanbacteria bacterium]|nr:MAG: DUF1232 domain-containing protein [Candidatus Schekmanbacteria bacterium]